MSVKTGGVAYSKKIPGMIIAIISHYDDEEETHIVDTVHFYGTIKNFEKDKKFWERIGWEVKYAFIIKERIYP